ncbi:MAG: short chain dehydrogenase [Gemmatales bacterium]|nr:MAG: short chain dehydrogenase [Gemmatales bacterium]
MSQRLANKRCLIVGGTSGIGLASAGRFVEEGAQVVVAGLDPPAGGASSKKSYFVRCDATDSKQVDALFEEAVRQLGGLDVLFHVAGGSGRRFGDGPLHECTEEGFKQTIELNLTSVFLTNRRALQVFLSQGQGGVILNVSSVLAWSPAPEHFDTCAYAAAKGGILSLSRLAAARYARDGIRVNVLAPGLIATPMSARATTDPVIGSFLKGKQPLCGGPGRPEDCAEAAVFLASDEARSITGAILPVDGGWSVA